MSFDQFWTAYPARRRVNKKGCLAIWQRQRLDDHAAEIIAHVEAMKRTQDWIKAGFQYAPMAQTYLNQERWQDGLPEPTAVPQPSFLSQLIGADRGRTIDETPAQPPARIR